MINKKDFKKIRLNLEKYDKKREELIKKARDVLKLSKQLIYSIHRKNLEEASNLISNLKKDFNWLKLTKPVGSRKESSEIYIVGYGFQKRGAYPV